MLKRNKDGLYYVSDKTGKVYELNYGSGISPDKPCTSDICFILDSGLTEEEYDKIMNNEEFEHEFITKFVNWFYGASFITDIYASEVQVIKDYVDEYERKKTYEFTEQGVEDFYNDAVDNVIEAIKSYKTIDINIKVGNLEITIPNTSNNYEMLGAFLRECQKDTVPIK